MRALRVFFLGFVYGWLMKWIIDEIYTRDNLRRVTNENEYLRDRLQALEAVRSSRSQPAQPSDLTLTPPERTLPAPTASPPRTRGSSRKDDLKIIKGIGPQLEKKLNNAGVLTFEQMSRLTTAELQSILGISKRATQNADNLLTQARRFAQGKSNQRS